MKVTKTRILQRARQILAETIERCPRYAEKLRGVRFEANARMTACAGKAQYRTKTVKLSMAFFEDEENFTSSFFNTVTHELAHLVIGIEGRNRRPHGPEWKLVHISMGGDGQRCHALELADGHTKRKRRAKMRVPCPRCGETMLMGPTQHKRHRMLQANGHEGYAHRRCPQ